MDPKRRIRGDQFTLEYEGEISFEIVKKVIAGQTSILGSEIRMMSVKHTDRKTIVILKTSSALDFRGENTFTVEKSIPIMSLIRGKDSGLEKELDTLQGTNLVNLYKMDKSVVIKDENGGYMFTEMLRDPKFDTTARTKFGRGHRRVLPNIVNGKKVGFKFVPFKEYTPEWASDIYGYDCFEEMIENIYPYQISDTSTLKEMFMNRPRNFRESKMIPTPWQQECLKLLDIPPSYDVQKRNIYWFTDFVGETGKSMLTKHILSTRDDTLFISSTGKLSDLICSVQEPLNLSTKINNIVFDLPRENVNPGSKIKFHLMDHDDTIKFMECCCNGMFTATKYKGMGVNYDKGLNVIVFSNSLPLITVSSLYRWKINIIKDVNDLLISNLSYTDKKLISKYDEVVDFYTKNSILNSHLKDLGIDGISKPAHIHSGID